MASEFKDFLATLEPVWEDVHEFDWLKNKEIHGKEMSYAKKWIRL